MEEIKMKFYSGKRRTNLLNVGMRVWLMLKLILEERCFNNVEW
jgi:hypothetical protein